ncbi:hypothetical protein H7X87_01860 [Acetobacteraceae bacterium]|nr:hypothetical protein [Candidatus Parcubacteria bacterium]
MATLRNAQKVHFIGIGGVGMSPTAKLLKDSGIEVTGSDEEVYPPVSDFLVQEGLPYRTPYKAENIPADADLIVIGKNAKLVPETNEEVAAALASGKTILSYPEVLGILSENKETIIVAGSYGKSSTAALLSHCLVEAGLDPSFFIGAIPYSPSTSAKLGDGKLFVLEGDEYPSSNTDARAKFLHYHPSHLLITPLAHDHFNVFPTTTDYLKPFSELINILPPEGTITISTAGSLSKEFIASLSRPSITYGVTEGEFHAAHIVWGEKTRFDILSRRKVGTPTEASGQNTETVVADVETSQLGEHNVENIVGVAAFLFSHNLVTPEQFAEAVKSFKGIRRRLDKKSEKTSIPIYEGFGSSYEKARSAIEAMRLHFPKRRLLIIFEPHTFSWRNRASLSWYDTVFEGASKIYIYEPAAQGAATHEQLTQEEIIERTKKAGFDVEKLLSPDISLTQDDVVLILTSGHLGGLMEPIIAHTEAKFPKMTS